MRTFALYVLMSACATLAAAASWRVGSPDEKLAIEVQTGEKTCYRVLLGNEVVLGESPLGIVRDDQRFDTGLVFEGERRRHLVEDYEMLTGKRRHCHAEANELTLVFHNANGAKLELILRAYNDGVAFRYRFPESDKSTRTVTEELTGFQIPGGATAFIQPYDEATKWTPAYEAYFENGIPAGSTTTNKAGWCFPALFRLRENGPWLLLTEALLDGSYCGTRLKSEAPGGLYRIRFPDTGEGLKTGQVNPSNTLPWATPWRVILTGPTLATIVESTLVTDLNPPNAIRHTGWIQPGRVAWSWWSEQDSPRKPERMKAFIDLAAELGWEYFLVDANWNYVEEPAILDLLRYAKSKNVGILLWYNSGGPHNEVTEAPRDRMLPQAVRQREFAWLRRLGVKGVKVDFFQSDKQNVIQHYLDILRDAAAANLMVNFHGCTLQRGWARTWPNLITMEGVRGAECYIFDKNYPDRAPWHNTILPFTRNVCGSMDYTPVTFSDNNNPHKTTVAHELALSVVFESGWTHFADGVNSYRSVPSYVKDFLRHVPTTWDDVKYLAGTPGQNIVLARRHGKNWYLAGINGTPNRRTETISLGFLPTGTFTATLIGDGDNPRAFSRQQRDVSSHDTLDVTLQALGGFTVVLQTK